MEILPTIAEVLVQSFYEEVCLSFVGFVATANYTSIRDKAIPLDLLSKATGGSLSSQSVS